MRSAGLTSISTASAVTLLALSSLTGHVIYPATLAVLSRGRRQPEPQDPTAWPAVTILISAYREAGVIGAKVADVVANGYPGAVEVLVVAEDEETAAAARAAGARVVQPPTRLGKAQAINRGMEEASHDIVVLNDANNRLPSGCLAKLVRHFGNPDVAAVAGEKVEADGGGEELYWRFESWLKQREWALGSTIGLVGELAAVRREAWRPIPADISADDLWIALDYNERGHLVAYEPAARSIDPPYEDANQRWERRTRISGTALYVHWRKRRLLRPARAALAFQIVGHKLWRSTAGPLSHAALLGLAVRRAPASRLATLFLAGHLAGGAALWWRERGHGLPEPLGVGAQVLYLQVVAIGGMVRFARGERLLKWAKPDR